MVLRCYVTLGLLAVLAAVGAGCASESNPPPPTLTPLLTSTATPTSMPASVPTATPTQTASAAILGLIPDLIPRDALFELPNNSDVQISPDGTRISYLAPVCALVRCVMNVWVAPLDDPSAAEPVTAERTSGVREYGWAFTNKHILFTQDTDGDENWRVYSVDLTTGQTTGLTPPDDVQARLQEPSPNYQDEILIGLNDRDPELHDLYRVNIRNGERRLVQRNEGFVEFIIDNDYTVRFAMRLTSDGGSEILSPTTKGGWELFAKIEMEDSLTTFPLGFDETDEVLYIMDSRERDTAALIAVNLDTGESTVIAEDPRADEWCYCAPDRQLSGGRRFHVRTQALGGHR